MSDNASKSVKPVPGMRAVALGAFLVIGAGITPAAALEGDSARGGICATAQAQVDTTLIALCGRRGAPAPVAQVTPTTQVPQVISSIRDRQAPTPVPVVRQTEVLPTVLVKPVARPADWAPVQPRPFAGRIWSVGVYR